MLSSSAVASCQMGHWAMVGKEGARVVFFCSKRTSRPTGNPSDCDCDEGPLGRRGTTGDLTREKKKNRDLPLPLFPQLFRPTSRWEAVSLVIFSFPFPELCLVSGQGALCNPPFPRLVLFWLPTTASHWSVHPPGHHPHHARTTGCTDPRPASPSNSRRSFLGVF